MNSAHLVLPMIALLAGTCGSAANPQVYMVIASNCGPKQSSFAQTGFRTRVGAETGILTALHGVVGCTAVTARHESRQTYVQDLQLSREWTS